MTDRANIRPRRNHRFARDLFYTGREDPQPFRTQPNHEYWSRRAMTIEWDLRAVIGLEATDALMAMRDWTNGMELAAKLERALITATCPHLRIALDTTQAYFYGEVTTTETATCLDCGQDLPENFPPAVAHTAGQEIPF